MTDTIKELVEQIFDDPSQLDKSKIQSVNINDLLNAVVIRFENLNCFTFIPVENVSPELWDKNPEPSTEEIKFALNIAWFALLFVEPDRHIYLKINMVRSCLIRHNEMRKMIMTDSNPWGMLLLRIKGNYDWQSSILTRIMLCTWGSDARLLAFKEQKLAEYWKYARNQ